MGLAIASAAVAAFGGGIVAAAAGAAPARDAGVKVSGRVYAAAPAGKAADGRTPAAGAAVHLRDAPAGWDPGPPAEPVDLKFADGKLAPAFACVQVGQALRVKCPEGEVFALRADSPARPSFGRVMPPDMQVFTDRFPKPDDFVSLVCSIHPAARAHIQVVPTPGFALCDGEGRFTLTRRLPKGEHVLRGFLPGAGRGERAVTVRGDEGEVSVVLELAPRKAKEQK